MATIKVIDPVTRIEGHLKIEVTVDTVGGLQQVVEAKATGTLFRGFEQLLLGRDPRDAQHITERICGVCPVSHGTAASMALEAAARMKPPANARIMRNLVLGSNFVQSHVLHFYHLALLDFIPGPAAMPPWTPAWEQDRRLSAGTTALLQGNYVKALEMRRKAHEMAAIFGGRMPHPPAFVPGGFTTTPRSERIGQFRNYVAELITFITNVYMPDVEILASSYPDYYNLGKGHGNLLAFGVFDLDDAGTNKLLKRGRITSSSTAVQALDLAAITEQVDRSWYAPSNDNLHPANGATTPQYPKTNAYSWLKAPRYAGQAYEAGPLARMKVNGSYSGGVSVMDRHRARAAEALKIAQAMQQWVGQLNPSGSVYTQPTMPLSASAYGLTEAPRGALGHWVQIANGKLSRYQVVTPTCWNASPADGNNVKGPLEQALMGVPVKNVDQPIEVLRVIHSYDPCLSCAVHVARPKEKARSFRVEHTHGEEGGHDHDHGHGPANRLAPPRRKAGA